MRTTSPAVEPHAQRLMARRMAVGRQADHAAVAEHVVLAVDEQHVVAVVVVLRREAEGLRALGIFPGLPLPSLDDDARVRQRCRSAGVVEVEVRERRRSRRGPRRPRASSQPAADLFPGMKLRPGTRRPGSRAGPSDRAGCRGGGPYRTARALWVVDQEHRDGLGGASCSPSRKSPSGPVSQPHVNAWSFSTPASQHNAAAVTTGVTTTSRRPRADPRRRSSSPRACRRARDRGARGSPRESGRRARTARARG